MSKARLKAMNAFRPSPKIDYTTNKEQQSTVYRVLTNALRIIESMPFQGGQTAKLVLECHEYLLALRSMIPKPENAPTEIQGELLERVKKEVEKENGTVQENLSLAPVATDPQTTPDSTPQA